MKLSKYFYYKEYTEEELRDIILHLFRAKELSPTSKKQYSIKIPQWISYLDSPKTLHNLIWNPKTAFTALEKTDKITFTPKVDKFFSYSNNTYSEMIDRGQ